MVTKININFNIKSCFVRRLYSHWTVFLINNLYFSNFNVCCKIKFQVDDKRRLKPKKDNLGPAPLWIKLGGKTSQLDRNEILKAARQFKSSIKFKNVFIIPDLSVCQRKRLNELKVIRNELNNKISNSSYAVNSYYGIRNNKVIKLSKDVYEDTESIKKLKLHTLSEEIIAQKEFLINSLEKVRSEFMDLISSSQITINNNNEVIKTLTETVVLVHNRTKDLYNISDEKFTFNYAII
jgi:hypothetical protein